MNDFPDYYNPVMMDWDVGRVTPVARKEDEKQFLTDTECIRLGMTVFGHYINCFNRQLQNTFRG